MFLVYTPWIHYKTAGNIEDEKYLSETQPAITCLKLTMKNLEQGVKYVQS